MSEEGMRIIKRITGKRVELTGNTNLQSLAAAPLAEQAVTMDLALLANGCDGYLMRYQATDAALSGSMWHASLPAAETHANALFGLRRSDWQIVENQNETTAPRQTPVTNPSGKRNPRQL